MEYQGQVALGPLEGGFKDAGPRQAAEAKYVWRFEVPEGGEATPSSHRFTIPVNRAGKGADELASLSLKTRFKIDDLSKAGRPGFGEVIETTFAMGAPAGVKELSRCLRLRDEGERLAVETAESCLDEAFDRQGGGRVRVSPLVKE